MRIIKIITPSNDSLNIEFNSKETEIRELISMLTNIPGKEIKGICDKYGTNYTLSFAVQSPMINNELSDYYFLVTKNQNNNHHNNFQSQSNNKTYCTPNYFCYNETSNNFNNSFNNPSKQKYGSQNLSPFHHPQNIQNNFMPNPPNFNYGNNNMNSNMNNSGYISHNNMPFLSPPHYSQHLTNQQTNRTNNNNNHFNNNPIINSHTNSYYPPQNIPTQYNNNLNLQQSHNNSHQNPFQIDSFVQEDQNYNNYNQNQYKTKNANNNNNSTRIDNGIKNQRFYSYDRNINSNQSKRCIYTEFSENKEDMEKYLNIVKSLNSNKQITQTTTITLQKLITEEKGIIINLFKSYLSGNIGVRELINDIDEYINETSMNSNQEMNRPTTAIPQKKNLFSVLDELPSRIFEDRGDRELLKTLAMSNYSEIIKSSWEVFSSDKDFENFVDTLRRIISYHKQHSLQNSNNNSNRLTKYNKNDFKPNVRTNQHLEIGYPTFPINNQAKNQLESIFTKNKFLSIEDDNNQNNFTLNDQIKRNNIQQHQKSEELLNERNNKLGLARNFTFINQIKQEEEKTNVNKVSENKIFDKKTVSEIDDKINFRNSVKSVQSINSIDFNENLNNNSNKNILNTNVNLEQRQELANQHQKKESTNKINVGGNSNNNINFSIKADPNQTPKNSSVNNQNPNLANVLINKDLTTNVMTGKQNTSNPVTPKKVSFDGKIGSVLKKCLHTWQLSVVNYFVSNGLPQKEEIIQKRYELKDNEDQFIRTVKNICSKFIEDKILCFYPDCATQMNDLIVKRTLTNNIFKKFFQSKSLEQLKNDLYELVINQSQGGSNKEVPPSSHQSPDSKNDLTVKKSTKTSLKNNIQTSSNNNDTNKQLAYEHTLEVIKKINFLSSEEKLNFEKKVYEKDPKALEILDEYIAVPNLQKLKNSVQLMQIRYKNSESRLSSGLSSSSGKMPAVNEYSKISAPQQNVRAQKMDSEINNLKITTKTFEKIIEDFLLKGKLTRQQYLLLKKRYVNKDETLLSIWESYTTSSNLDDLLESLNLYTNYFLPKLISKNHANKTTNYSQNLKTELVSLIKSTEEASIEEYKGQQYKVVETFVKDKLIDQKYLKTLGKLIIEEDSNIYAIFEIFFHKRDIPDMIETLGILAEINFNPSDCHDFSSDDSEYERIEESPVHSANEELAIKGTNKLHNFPDETFSKIFRNFKYANVFTPLEIGYLKTNQIKNDAAIYSALKCYMEDKNDESFKTKLQNILNKNKMSESDNVAKEDSNQNDENSRLLSSTFKSLLSKQLFDKSKGEFLIGLYKKKDIILRETLMSYIRNKDEADLLENLEIIFAKHNINKQPSQQQQPPQIQVREVQKNSTNQDECLLILENYYEKEKISKSYRQYLNNQYTQERNLLLCSSLEAYKQNKDYNELKETMIIVMSKIPKTNETKPELKPIIKTSSYDIKNSKENSILDKLQNKYEKQPSITNINREEDPDQRFIRILYKFNKKFNYSSTDLEILREYVVKKDEVIISAFEAYEKNNDDDDFFETLDVIIEKNKSKVSQKSPHVHKTSSNEESFSANKKNEEPTKNTFEENSSSKYKRLIKMYIKNYPLPHEDLDILLELITCKDQFVLSSLESYDKYQDHQDFNENLQIALEKAKSKLSKEEKSFFSAMKKFQQMTHISIQQLQFLKSQNKTNEFLKSSIEAFERNINEEDLKENIDFVLKKYKEPHMDKSKDTSMISNNNEHHESIIDSKFVSCMKELNKIYKLKEHEFNILQICLLKNKQGKDKGILISILDSFIKNKDLEEFKENVDLQINKEKDNLQKLIKKFAKSFNFSDADQENLVSKLIDNNKTIIQALLNYYSKNENEELRDILTKILNKEKKYSSEERGMISRLNGILKLILESVRKIDQKEYYLLKKLLIESKNQFLISQIEKYEKNKNLLEFDEALKLIRSKYN